MIEQRVRERSADALVEEDEHQGNFGPLVGEAVKITLAVPFQQTVGFQLAEVVAPLSKGISAGRQAKAGENDLMDIGRGRDGPCGPPPAQIRTGGSTAYGSCLRLDVTRRSAPPGKDEARGIAGYSGQPAVRSAPS
jgi:hypothetical protein